VPYGPTRDFFGVGDLGDRKRPTRLSWHKISFTSRLPSCLALTRRVGSDLPP
jgi:hypothetical protein